MALLLHKQDIENLSQKGDTEGSDCNYSAFSSLGKCGVMCCSRLSDRNSQGILLELGIPCVFMWQDNFFLNQ